MLSFQPAISFLEQSEGEMKFFECFGLQKTHKAFGAIFNNLSH